MSKLKVGVLQLLTEPSCFNPGEHVGRFASTYGDFGVPSVTLSREGIHRMFLGLALN